MTTNAAPPPAANGLTVADLLTVLRPFCPVLYGSDAGRGMGVQQHSRRVEFGDLFGARTGSHADGRQFIETALHRGAAAVLVDRGGDELPVVHAPVICVTDARRAAAFAAEAVLGHPSQQLSLVGITGTNGKTTTVALVERGLAAAGAKPARLGTTGFAFEGTEHESNLTTPEADQISRYIAQVVRQGGSDFGMEAARHALDQGRVDALRFDVVAFTNLTQDHLDHHGDMGAYEAAKLRLFTELAPGTAVINVDDPAGQRFATVARAREVIRVGRSSACDLCAAHVTLSEQGIVGELRVQGRSMNLETRLVGEHNLENILVAPGVLQALGVDLHLAGRGCAGGFTVPGRLERCDSPIDDVIVLVDYAHTPDALERVLQAVRKFAKGSIHCVFGCGGDRDPKKRPLMGQAVGRWADRATVTNDNPRTEAPEAIASAIEPGLRESANLRYDVLLDRRAAIQAAVLAAHPGDTVVIAGKGHENYQIIGTVKRPFDDREEARVALAIRRNATAQTTGARG